jgi:hypothetical protein
VNLLLNIFVIQKLKFWIKKIKDHGMNRQLSDMDDVVRKKVVVLSRGVSSKSSLSGASSGILEHKCEDIPQKSSPSITVSLSDPPRIQSPLTHNYNPEPNMSQSLQPTNYLKPLKTQFTLSESQNKKDNILKMQAARYSKKLNYCDPYKKINPFGSIRVRLDPEETKKQKLRKQALIKKKPVIDYFGSSVSSSTPRKRLNPNPQRKIKVQKHRAGKICVQKMEIAYSGHKKPTDPEVIQRELV